MYQVFIALDYLWCLYIFFILLYFTVPQKGRRSYRNLWMVKLWAASCNMCVWKYSYLLLFSANVNIQLILERYLMLITFRVFICIIKHCLFWLEITLYFFPLVSWILILIKSVKKISYISDNPMNYKFDSFCSSSCIWNNVVSDMTNYHGEGRGRGVSGMNWVRWDRRTILKSIGIYNTIFIWKGQGQSRD